MENSNAQSQSSEKQSTSTPNSQSVRQASDPGWEHCTKYKGVDGKVVYTCLYCSSNFKGGGIHGMKQHLAGIRGQVAPCKKVPHDVRVRINDYINQASQQRKEDKEAIKNMYGDDASDYELEEKEDDVVEVSTSKGKQILQNKKKKKANNGIESFFAPRTTPGSQPSLKSVLAGKEAKKRADMAWARWFCDACIPFNTLHSPYFQIALDASLAIGPGYKSPSYNDVRINLLRECKKECQLLVDSYRAKWASSGCTIMADGWKDQRDRTLINFLVYCSDGISFIKSVDASDVVKDAQTLCNLFSEIVEWVGPPNVVHVVTDNTSNYVAAGKLLHEKYEHIYWSPCAAYCLNLILKDIGNMPQIVDLASRAAAITRFVYNHSFFLALLRKKHDWKEIVRPGPTRFATTFITLKSIYDHKQILQNFVTCKTFTSHKLAKSTEGKAVTSIILDNKFWEDCLVIVKIVGPIIRLLRIVDSDEKPSLGYIYEGMYRVIERIKKIFMNKTRFYTPFTQVIERRWDKHFMEDLHAAAYFLNPAFIYEEDFCETVQVMNGLYGLLEIKSICDDEISAMKEIRIYRERQGNFNRQAARNSTKTIQPDKWWRLFGHGAPNLQKIAVRILSQTAASSGCERNWSVFERIHTKKRNILEHQRLNDLVYVTYNLKLKHRLHSNKKSYDPIDYECIDKTDFWIEEEDSPQELDCEELERELYEECANPNSNNDGSDKCGDFVDPEMLDMDSFDFGHRFGAENIIGSEIGLHIHESDDDRSLP